MMKRITLLFVVALLSLSGVARSQNIHDAFVLVDVSGTMEDAAVNEEAKNIIIQMLIGKFNEDDCSSDGWTKSRTDDRFPSGSFLNSHSLVCMIPFGDIKTIEDNRTKHRYTSDDELKNYFLSNFPSKFGDHFTYLTLAKAWVGSVAVTETVKTAYVFIYSDGCNEDAPSQLDNDNQRRLDDLQHAGSNGFRKIGCLRKNGRRNRHYDIEVWEFQRYNTIGEVDTLSPPPPPIEDTIRPQSISIISPSDGRNAQQQHKVKLSEGKFTVKWKGGAADVSVEIKEGNAYKTVRGNEANECFDKHVAGSSATFDFYKPGNYRITVRGRDGNGSSKLYVSVSRNILPYVILVLLIVAVVAGIIYILSLRKPKPSALGSGGWDENDGHSRNENSTNGELDW